MLTRRRWSCHCDLHGDVVLSSILSTEKTQRGRKLFLACAPHPLDHQPILALAGTQRAVRGDDRGGLRSFRGILGTQLGTEILSKLEEGTSGSADRCPRSPSMPAAKRVDKMRRVIMSYPLVRTVGSEQGRGDYATYLDGLLSPNSSCPEPVEERPVGWNEEAVVKELADRLEGVFMGADFIFRRHRGQHRGGCSRREGEKLGQDLRCRPRRSSSAVQR